MLQNKTTKWQSPCQVISIYWDLTVFQALYSIIHMHSSIVSFDSSHNPLLYVLLATLCYGGEKRRGRKRFGNWLKAKLLGSCRGWFWTLPVWLTLLTILVWPFFTVLPIPNHEDGRTAHSFGEGVCYWKFGWLTTAPDVNATDSSSKNGKHPFWDT